MKSKKFFKFFNHLIFIVLVIFAIVLLTEIYLRYTCRQKLARWNQAEFVPDPILGYRYKADTSFVLSNTAFSNICKSNSHGFPLPDFERKKKEGFYRILLLGNSDDTGFFSNGSYSYIQFLQNFFEKNNFPVEIINCSTDGWYRVMRNINFIKNEGVFYDPDLILLRNGMPISDEKFYRETYKGYLYLTPDTNNIEKFKEKIDHFIANKSGWLKLYDLSYIFRYYMKIYIDSESNKINPQFVKFTEKRFDKNALNDIRLYVRKLLADWGPSMNVQLFDSYPDWDKAKVTWNSSQKANRLIRSFSSWRYEQNWIETDITSYLNEKLKEQTQYLSITLSSPHKAEEKKYISFASKKTQSPELHIKENQDGQTTEVILYPVDDGYIRSGVYSNNNFEALDSIIRVENNMSDSIRGLLKFDISNLKNIESASLKLFVTKLEVGDLHPARKYTLTESADTLKNLQTFLENRDIQFAVYDTYETSLKYAKSYANRDINYIYLAVPYKPEYTFGKLDGHTNQKGHQVIAEAFFEALTNGVIPERFMQH